MMLMHLSREKFTRALTVVCPACSAAPGESCTIDGRRTDGAVHQVRLFNIPGAINAIEAATARREQKRLKRLAQLNGDKS